MVKDNVGKAVIINGNVENANELKNYDLLNRKLFYEVIRVIDGVPLFFEDHYDRLEKSLNMMNWDLDISINDLNGQINKVLEVNQQINCNIKVIVFTEQTIQNCIVNINKSYYPQEKEYERGVPVSLFKWERESPNAKIVNNEYKDTVAKKLKEDKVFELLLVNENDHITEGSKSNVFFIKDSKIFTASGEHILKGITRQYIIQACKNIGIEVIEELISTNSLKEIDGLFISGTSIKVLPVSKVGEYKYNSSHNEIIVSIGKEFDRIIEEYIKNKL